MRIFNLMLAGCVVALAFVIYEQKYQSEALVVHVAELKQSIKSERDAVAVLRAEWSHLNRPKRIERLARKHLGMRPLKARQLLTERQYEAIRQTAPADVAARILGQPIRPKTHRKMVLR
ncbi:MAG: cell division protein FtsL [Alphaproteobacteria bacterium]